MRLFRSKTLAAAEKPRNSESAGARSSVQSFKSCLFSCIPIKAIAISCEPDFIPTQQQEGCDDLLPIKSQSQNEGFDKSCHLSSNPLYTEDPAPEQHQCQLSHSHVEVSAQSPNEPVLMPQPLKTQAEKLCEAEDGILQSKQQLQTHQQMHLDALSKLSEQHETVIKQVQAESKRQLRQQKLAHDSITASIHAQHAIAVRQIIRKDIVIHTQALDVAQAKFDVERSQQQSLHEQTLRGHSAELGRQARRHCMKLAAQYQSSMQSLKARHDIQLKQQQIRLLAEHQADKEAHRLENAALQSQVTSAQEETQVLRSKLIQQQQRADAPSLACLDAEVLCFSAACCSLTTDCYLCRLIACGICSSCN